MGKIVNISSSLFHVVSVCQCNLIAEITVCYVANGVVLMICTNMHTCLLLCTCFGFVYEHSGPACLEVVRHVGPAVLLIRADAGCRL